MNGTELEELKKPLACVNRYAEALDVLVPNLDNLECLRCGLDVKYDTPLAAQPPGTGKTALGRNITAERLRGAWCWRGGDAPAVEKALRDARDENLVLRTLLAHFPHHEETIMLLKHAEPLIIEMKALVTPDFGWGFDKAPAYAIFCTARGLRGSRPSTKTAFLSQDSTLQTAVGMVEELIEERNGAPVVLVLDDITDLDDPDFARDFATVQRPTPLHRAMHKLSRTLQLLHGIPRCSCTARDGRSGSPRAP